MQFPYLPIRLAIVDHHEIFREGLKLSIEKIAKGKIDIVADLDNNKQLLSIIDEQKPDIILTDIQLPVADNLLSIKQIQEKNINSGVIVLLCVYCNPPQFAD